MKSLIQTLIDRDGITEEEARENITACREEMMTAIEEGDFTYAEQIYEDWFGLEPDWMFEVVEYIA